jgi:hemerythrin
VKKTEWSEAYSVGVRELDEQHVRFFKIIQSLEDADLTADGGAPKRILSDLGEYAATHFQTEEKYFGRFGYPAAEAHIREHREFEEKIAEFRKVYQIQKTFNSGVIREFVKKWLIHHILISDRKYTACFHENGLK